MREVVLVSLATRQMGDDSLKLKVAFGRESFAYNGTAASTWSDVISIVETSAGIEAGGLRLIFRGKTVVPSETLGSSGVKNGSRLMALKTAKQHSTERSLARFEKAKETAAEVEELKDATRSKESSDSTGGVASSRHQVFGDEVPSSESDFYVKVTCSGKTYCVKVEPDALTSYTVADLKARLREMCGVEPRHQNLICAGKRNISDSDRLLEDLHVKRGGHMMLLAKEERHKMMETRMDFETLCHRVEVMQQGISKVERRVRGRLVSDFAELVAAIAPLESEHSNLSRNLAVLRVDDCDAGFANEVRRVRADLEGLKDRINVLRDCASSRIKN